MQGSSPFGNTGQPAYTRVQPGFTLGGPIVKNRTFFFLGYEGTFRQESGYSTIGANHFDLLTVPFGPAGSNLDLTPEQVAFFSNSTIATVLRNPAVNPTLYAALQKYLFLAGASSAMAQTGLQPVGFGGRPGFATTWPPPTRVRPT